MNNKITLRLLALFFGTLGFIVLGSVLFPLLAYEITAPRNASFVSPIPDNERANFGNALFDDTKASSWFVGGAKSSDFVYPKVSFYNLSVPVLNIKDATVAIGGEDLSKSLIQYPGTAVPGQAGNTVVFGHSVLPQFYNPSSYISIFSTLPTLQPGEVLSINYDGVAYRYRVEDKFEVMPTDIQILEQNVSDSFLTLVTCVPPGNPLRPRRLIVRARIIPPDANSISSN